MTADSTSAPWCVYILRCADSSLYTGITTNLYRRLREHNGEHGNGARYTRPRRPVTLAYHEESENRREACKREAEIKKLSRAEKEWLIKTGAEQQHKP